MKKSQVVTAGFLLLAAVCTWSARALPTSEPAAQQTSEILVNDLTPGTVVYILGKAPEAGGQFNIDLVPEGRGAVKGDLALRLQVEIGAVPEVTCGSIVRGEWIPVAVSKQAPFEAGEIFRVSITIQQYGFEIAVNGEHLENYTYQLPNTEQMKIQLVGASGLGFPILAFA